MARIRMMIKESEFHDDDYYVAIKFWDEETYSFCGYLSRQEILDNNIIDLPYSRGYSFLLSELNKMTTDFYKKELTTTQNEKKIIPSYNTTSLGARNLELL